MSNTKKWRGQDQIFIGSPTGEPLTTFRFDQGSNPCSGPQYVGEAKRGSVDADCRWHIEMYDYDLFGSVKSIKIASNKLTPTFTELEIDTTANPGFTTITITGGSFFDTYVAENDRIELKTAGNHIKNQLIESITDTEILVKADSAVDETVTSAETFLITLTNDKTTKDFDQRRWDLRSYYVYN